MTYQEQIKHPKWQKKRLQILERDNFTCQGCMMTDKQLHVHHLLYDNSKKAWELEDRFYTTLCDECHKEVSEDVAIIIRIVRIICETPFNSNNLRSIITSIMQLR